MADSVLVLGTQWGDEGKGKIVDLAVGAGADLVVRFQGGHNAGGGGPHAGHRRGEATVLLAAAHPACVRPMARCVHHRQRRGGHRPPCAGVEEMDRLAGQGVAVSVHEQSAHQRRQCRR